MTDSAPEIDAMPFMLDAKAAADGEPEQDRAEVEDAVQRGLDCEAEIERLEEALAAEKKKLTDILERELPEYMSKIRSKGLDLENGARVVVTTQGRGSLNRAPDIEEAVGYLEKNGLKGGVTTDITVKFSADEAEKARACISGLSAPQDRAVEVKRGINAQTLKAWVLRRIQTDPEFDAEKVGIHVYRAAKFTKRPDKG